MAEHIADFVADFVADFAAGRVLGSAGVFVERPDDGGFAVFAVFAAIFVSTVGAWLEGEGVADGSDLTPCPLRLERRGCAARVVADTVAGDVAGSSVAMFAAISVYETISAAVDNGKLPLLVAGDVAGVTVFAAFLRGTAGVDRSEARIFRDSGAGAASLCGADMVAAVAGDVADTVAGIVAAFTGGRR